MHRAVLRCVPGDRSPRVRAGPGVGDRVAAAVHAGMMVLPDPAATAQAGQALGHALEAFPGGAPANGAVIVGLAGDLGAGKTTLARATLRALGVAGTVRSPTYTIAEPYETRIGRVWHLDLYRLAAPDEIEYIGIRDLVSESVACLVEWPERGRGGLPDTDCRLAIEFDGQGRRLRIDWSTERGRAIGARMRANLGAYLTVKIKDLQ